MSTAIESHLPPDTSERGRTGGKRGRDSSDAFALLRKGIPVQGRVRYRLEESLGAGAFGAVWRASCGERDSGDQDPLPASVAIKFFRAPESAVQEAQIKRELSALLSLRARNVPRVYDWLVTDRLCFFVMDYFARGSVGNVFAEGGKLDDGGAWRLLTDLLRACQAAHRAGVLHLDIKPANIMLEGAGKHVLVDFGISQASQVAQGEAHTIDAGSPGYQAPEQYRQEIEKFETRTDLWSVGATVWALRSGIDLSRNQDRVDLDATGSQPSLPPLSAVARGCSLELENVIARMVSADPVERFGGAADVMARVKAALTGQPLEGEVVRGHRRGRDDDQVRKVIDALMDPLWSAVCQRADLTPGFVRFDDGEYLCREGEASHHAFLVLNGRVQVERGSRILAIYDQEGTFVGELSTLTGTARTASVKAQGEVWACVFNAAEFEHLLAFNAAIGIRLLKLMAERLIRTDVHLD